MNMSNILNSGGFNVYENPASVGGQNGENKGDSQGAFSPHKEHLQFDDHHHSVSYEDDENGPSVVILMSDLENWDSCGRTLHLQKVVYKNLPNACFNCMKLGHFIKECPERKKDEPVQAALEPKKKDDFQPVGRKAVSRTFKINKASSSKNCNRFSPFLEEIFDPLECAEDHGEVQAQMVKENVPHSDIQMDFISNKEKPNLVSENIARGSPLNSTDKGPSSTSSFDEEDDSIPNTQAAG
ncbi:hypothetical protein L7F22_033483 [Adiantum nelumboides]|nr:hypothetical protein [Adiantum nelumboides]